MRCELGKCIKNKEYDLITHREEKSVDNMPDVLESFMTRITLGPHRKNRNQFI